ncbi:hypothetical protein MBSD_n2031 [Mizugakiibacter sediminis]|uniref:DUF2069 domain-containing protein n=1 Tax=Mizugakiibacter sediminis TaxID=1475481 RepID=A0A0K8QPV9_9GAMM|nr:DUF2069 domain-containing protein [Mizugakiibacter sediminis]GAP66716.1 hypothetical protein MBSD_n2031 [Mizugakiibacter sediminis]
MNARRLGYAAWAALGLLQILWHALLAPPARTSVAAALLLGLLPLALPLLALRRPARALLWAGIVSLFYFSHGVAEAWSAPDATVRALAVAEAALAALLVLSLGAGARKRRKPAAV